MHCMSVVQHPVDHFQYGWMCAAARGAHSTTGDASQLADAARHRRHRVRPLLFLILLEHLRAFYL